MEYKIIIHTISKIPCSIVSSAGVAIPFDPANTDYQAYLKWLSEGNTPLPPDQEG
jgi:hypothetical protein